MHMETLTLRPFALALVPHGCHKELKMTLNPPNTLENESKNWDEDDKIHTPPPPQTPQNDPQSA